MQKRNWFLAVEEGSDRPGESATYPADYGGVPGALPVHLEPTAVASETDLSPEQPNKCGVGYSPSLSPCSCGKGCHSPAISGSLGEVTLSPSPSARVNPLHTPFLVFWGCKERVPATALPWPVELVGHSFPSTGPGSWRERLKSPEGSCEPWRPRLGPDN